MTAQIPPRARSGCQTAPAPPQAADATAGRQLARQRGRVSACECKVRPHALRSWGEQGRGQGQLDPNEASPKLTFPALTACIHYCDSTARIAFVPKCAAGARIWPTLVMQCRQPAMAPQLAQPTSNCSMGGCASLGSCAGSASSSSSPSSSSCAPPGSAAAGFPSRPLLFSSSVVRSVADRT